MSPPATSLNLAVVQVRDGARPAVDGCSLTGNGEWGLRLQDAGGTYNGNVVAANAKGSVAYTLLDDEVSVGNLCRPVCCAGLLCACCAARHAWARVWALLQGSMARQASLACLANWPHKTAVLQVDTALMVVYNKLDRPVQSVGKM